MKEKKTFKMSLKNNVEEPVLYENTMVPYWVLGLMDTTLGKIRVISCTLTKRDKIDGYRARWGFNRDNYKVSPGLYAVGAPDSKSEVLVTSNYKLTFDKLRAELGGQNLWIVVLDTAGVNVWCAAGKGTFGTKELIGRIQKIKLDKLVEHKRIILPQLGAPGVSAHEVAKKVGFRVIYGPIRAVDIPEFLRKEFKATKEMREVRFDLMDRLIVTPVEIIHCLKYLPIIYIVLFLHNIIKPGEIKLIEVINVSMFNSLPYFIALFTGTVLFPALLPYIPFKAFSLKGLLLGLLLAIVTIIFSGSFKYDNSIFLYIGNVLIITSIVSFLGLNFTGSTTYTSLSGVVIETKYTTIIAAGAAFLGIVLFIINNVFKFF